MNFNDVFKSFKKKMINNLTNQKPVIVDTEKRNF